MILDSGDRTEFESGAVRDMQGGKGRCDLLPLGVICDLLHDNTLSLINEFQQSGHIYFLMDALKQGGTFNDVHTMILEVAKHFEEGAEKYGENNWQKGLPVRSFINSAIRHYVKWLRGDKDEPHDRAFCWNILCAIWTCYKKPELNEYRKDNENENN